MSSRRSRTPPRMQNTDEFRQAGMMSANEYIHARTSSAGTYLLPSVRTLAVARSAESELEAVGTAVLVWHRGQRFILSAAHVVDDNPDFGLFIGTKSAWVQIDGPFRVPVGGKRSDTFDLAFRAVS